MPHINSVASEKIKFIDNFILRDWPASEINRIIEKVVLPSLATLDSSEENLVENILKKIHIQKFSELFPQKKKLLHPSSLAIAKMYSLENILAWGPDFTHFADWFTKRHNLEALVIEADNLTSTIEKTLKDAVEKLFIRLQTTKKEDRQTEMWDTMMTTTEHLSTVILPSKWAEMYKEKTTERTEGQFHPSASSSEQIRL